MIKVFTGNVYGIQEEACDRDSLLLFFLDGHREEYIAVYRGENLIKILSYEDILYTREVPEIVLELNEDVFAEARKIFFHYENRLNRAVAVCNEKGEIECILHYCQNRTSFVYPVDEFKEYSLENELDLALLERADSFVIETFEEYTNAIIQVILKYFPQKKVICKDENLKLFFEETSFLIVDLKEEGDFGDAGVMYISSKLEKDYCAEQRFTMRYNSLDVMTSIFWRRKRVCFGE